MYQYQRFKAMDIKRTIKANGLTVKEVAEKMGITPVGLSQHINGNPSVEVLERIAAAIGCNVGDFFAPQPTNTITCPHCGKEAEVYSRITGYYRPIRNWNDGKQQEFKDRTEYTSLNK